MSSNNQMNDKHVLFAPEAELMIESLVTFELPEFGSNRWFSQHEHLEKLNMQAVLSAARNEDEFVKDFLVSSGKILNILGDLILTDVWKRQVFPEMVTAGKEPKTTIFLYAGLYHEVTVVSLLETCLFHAESVEALDENLLDLIDYLHRKLMDLVTNWPLDFGDDADWETGKTDPRSLVDEGIGGSSSSCLAELEKQNLALNFGIAMKCLNILRYVVDQCASGQLPLSVANRLLVVFDFPLLLVQIMDAQPWQRKVKSNNKLLRYVDSRWRPVNIGGESTGEDITKMTKSEAQVWLALFQLLMNQDLQRKYDFNAYRRSVFAKLRTYLNESVLDQLPILMDFRRFIEHLSFSSEVAPPKSEIVIEQIPEIYDKLIAKYAKSWKKLAVKQLDQYFDPSDPKEARKMASALAAAYNADAIEPLLMYGGEPPKCGQIGCGKDAEKRCSRCQTEWYCSRPCQVGHWPKHKPACDLIANTNQAIKNVKIEEQN